MEQKNKMVNFRTDLADEQITRLNQNEKWDSISDIYESHDLMISKTKVGKSTSDYMGKKPGIYYTIDLSDINFHDTNTSTKIERVIVEILDEILTEKKLKNKKALIVGLGNVNVTPDSLGPYTLDNIVVTRHLFEIGSVNPGYSEVSAISPGVMGTTGIETFDIITSIKDKIGVDYLIVVDALAAGSLMRVNKTIQISDAGISPGSGVGNKRKELSFDTMQIPVIAIGVPTVVDITTITNDTIDYLLKHLANGMDNPRPAEKLTTNGLPLEYDKIAEPNDSMKEMFFGKIGLLSDEEKKQLITEVLTPNGYNMMVTPKEVDEDIEDLAKIIATGIDIALHDSLKEVWNHTSS